MVLLSGAQLAVALAYTPGETPTIVAKAVGRDATSMLWCCQELGLPLVECAEMTREQIRSLVVNDEIPPWLFRPAAQSIALAQRNQAPARVRLVRSTSRAGDGLATRLGKTVEKLLDELEVARVHVAIGPQVAREALEQLLELHRHRLQIDTGVPLSPISLTTDLKEPPLGFAIKLVGVTECSGALEGPDLFGELLKELYRVVTQLSWRLLGYREVEALLASLEKRHRSLYHSLFPERMNVSILRQILRNLLKEGLSIRSLPDILEILSESPPAVQDPDQLTEVVRSGFSRQICQLFSDEKGILNTLLVEPAVEQQLMRQLHESAAALWLELDLDSSFRLLRSTAKGLEKAQQVGCSPVVLCSPRPRRFLRRLLEPTFPHLPVLSYSEIAPLTQVRTVGVVSL